MSSRARVGRVVLGAALLPLLAACPGPLSAAHSAPVPGETGGPAEASCNYGTLWTEVQLRTETGWPFVVARQAPARTTVTGSGPVAIDVAVERSGWRLRGRVDPAASGLAVTRPIRLSSQVALLPGSRPAILGVRPGGLRLGLPASTFDAAGGWRWSEVPATWTDCAALATDAPTTKPDPLAALGLGPRLREGTLDPESSIRWSHTADGPTFLTADSVKNQPHPDGSTRAYSVDVVEASGARLHVVTVARGVAVHGWVAAASLIEANVGKGLGTFEVVDAGPRPHCTLDRSVPLVARHPTGGERAIGELAASSRFVILRSSGAALSIAPPTGTGLTLPPAVEWWIRPPGSPRCPPGP